MIAPQFSPARTCLPACGIALLACLATPLPAQQDALVAEAVTFRKEPGGTPLGTVPAGVSVRAGRAQGTWQEVTLAGWIFAASTAPDTRDGYDIAVRARPAENLRRAPNEGMVARLYTGALLKRLETRDGWHRVERTGWVPATGLRKPSDPAPRVEAPAPTTGGDRVLVGRGTILASAPSGEVAGSLVAGLPGRVLGRSGEWARVQLEAWVREVDLKPAPGGGALAVTAAEVRATPGRFLGEILEWRLQLIAIQTADELRAELPAGQPYLLTRGPLPEAGFVYVIVTREQLPQFEAGAPLQEYRVRVRLKAPRTKYLEIPVVELVSVERSG